MCPIGKDFSVLSPNEKQIKSILKRRKHFSILLLALDESPSYISELVKNLGFNQKTIWEGVGYLENAGLVTCPNSINSIKNDRIRVIIGAKKRNLQRKIPKFMQNETLKRVKFYILTEKGKTFLDYAVECVKEVYEIK